MLETKTSTNFQCIPGYISALADANVCVCVGCRFDSKTVCAVHESILRPVATALH